MREKDNAEGKDVKCVKSFCLKTTGNRPSMKTKDADGIIVLIEIGLLWTDLPG